MNSYVTLLKNNSIKTKNKTMKYLFLSFITVFAMASWSQEDPVVLTINNQEVTKSEFLQVYLKNNDDPKFDKESLDEYLDLYKKFRLKVAEAERLGYDTIPSLVKELEGYREQLARPYLVDSSKNKELVEEAYERMKTEVRASHILINVAPTASPEDTLKAYNKIMALKKRIEAGEDFGTVAASADGSEDPSAKQNKGDLGYFTAFQMVYPFESAAYNTEVGQVSNPVRTKYGYHLIKVSEKRPARGTITTAHIMVRVPKSAESSDIDKAKKKIEEIYQQLKSGESFEKLAQLYSDDQGTKNKGGRLPAFGTGTNQRMVPAFEDAAFNLSNNGDYSTPFQTDYGFHIVKRISFDPLDSFEKLKKDLQSKVNRGSRGQKTQASFLNKLKEENKFKDKGDKRMDWFYTNVDSSIFKGKWEAPELKKNKWMFKYNDEKYDMQSFANYLSNLRRERPNDIKSFIDTKYLDWQNEKIIDDEKSTLEDRHPSYAALLKEYHDGVLLYEIMKDKVWDKAIQDTAGLQAFFSSNSQKYMWPDRISATVFSSEKIEMLDSAKVLYNSDSLSLKEILSQINKDSQLNLSVDDGKFIQSKGEFMSGKDFKKGVNPIYNFKGKNYLVIVHDFLKAQPKSLSEARGAAIQDYQEYLETEWLKEISQKHNITVNEEIFYSIGE
jgi:peptidyl-prolyl cis-trans isomerase SurA